MSSSFAIHCILRWAQAMLVISFSGKDFVSWRQSEGIYQGGTLCGSAIWGWADKVVNALKFYLLCARICICKICICTRNLQYFWMSVSFIKFDILWFLHLGSSWASKTCRMSQVSFTFVCKDLEIYLFCICKRIWICTRVCIYQCCYQCVCILRVEGWRKSPLLMCWKLAQASIADFSRPQNWIYWLTLSGEFWKPINDGDNVF